MTDHRDPTIREAVTTLALSSGPAPSFDELATEHDSDESSVRSRGWTLAVAVAAMALIVLGTMSLLFWGSDDPAPPADTVPTTIIPETATTIVPVTTSATPTTVVAPRVIELPPPSDGWDPILAETIAGGSPPAAACPPGTNPASPGPTDGERPVPSWVTAGAGAFNASLGTVVHVDVAGATWLFDVCTNTWHDPQPDGMPVHSWNLTDSAGNPSGAIGPLVYDVDSAVTVMMGLGNVAAYDAITNTWERRPLLGRTIDDATTRAGPFGAVYDPVSGLILTTAQSTGLPQTWELWAYDVDTDTWTEIGAIGMDDDGPCCEQTDLLGYSPELDRLILVAFYGPTRATLLVDPRTGATTIIEDPTTPIIDFVWPNHAFGQASGTVHAYDQQAGALRSFDPTTMTWSATGVPDTMPSEYQAFAVIVDDPINDRILLINGIHGDWWSDGSNDVWAFAPDTGDWTLILPERDPSAQAGG
jgi:hypothetical protein